MTKGARHKIFLSIQKLKERQITLRTMEKDILEGGNMRNALSELRSMLNTPIKAYSGSPGGDLSKPGSQASPPPSPGAGDGDTPGQVPEGDLPGQFTRVMGKGKIKSKSCSEIRSYMSELLTSTYKILSVACFLSLYHHSCLCVVWTGINLARSFFYWFVW